MAQDPDFAKAVVDKEEADEIERIEKLKAAGYPPGLESDDNDRSPLGYTDVVARLEIIIDRLTAVRAAIFASFSQDHKEPSWQPIPTPITEVDRERERRVSNELHELDRLLRGEGLDLRLLE